MKRLLIVTTMALITASASGCWRWFNRGSQCNPCATGTAAYADPCATTMDGAVLPGPMTTTAPMQ